MTARLMRPAPSPACVAAIIEAVRLALTIVTEPGEHPKHIIALAWRVLRQHWQKLPLTPARDRG